MEVGANNDSQAGRTILPYQFYFGDLSLSASAAFGDRVKPNHICDANTLLGWCYMKYVEGAGDLEIAQHIRGCGGVGKLYPRTVEVRKSCLGAWVTVVLVFAWGYFSSRINNFRSWHRLQMWSQIWMLMCLLRWWGLPCSRRWVFLNKLCFCCNATKEKILSVADVWQSPATVMS